MRMLLYKLFVGALLVVAVSVAGDRRPYDFVYEGNRLYQAGDYQAALEQYQGALQASPETAGIHYNIGNVYYRRYIFEKALEHYSRALQSVIEVQLESRIKYNLGNVKYRQAITSMLTFQDAMTPLRSAMAYYRDSLQLDPEQADARYNLELAQRMMVELRNQNVLAQNNPEQRNQKTSDNAGQLFEEAGNQQDQQQNLPDQQQQGEQQPTQGKQAQQAPPESASTENSQTQQASLPQEMTPEQAEQILELARERAETTDSQRLQWRQDRMLRDGAVEKFW
jgi:Ca-activated chloride channel family protein